MTAEDEIRRLNAVADRQQALEKRNKAIRDILREIIDDASPCTSACSRLVDVRLIDRAKELLGE